MKSRVIDPVDWVEQRTKQVLVLMVCRNERIAKGLDTTVIDLEIREKVNRVQGGVNAAIDSVRNS